MAEVVVREPDFLGAEQESDPLCLQLCANGCTRMLIQSPHRLLQHALAHCRRSYNQGAIGDGFGNRLIFLSLMEQVRGPDRGTSLAKSGCEGIHQPQPMSAKIAHRTSRSPNVQRIARPHQHDHETV
jgi:hypothetical protein